MKKRIKNIQLLFLLAAMVLAFSGCREKETTEINGNDSQQQETTEQPKETEKPEEEGEDSENKTIFAVPSRNGKLHIDGVQLIDEQGEAVQLKGISTHGLAWFPQYVNQDCFLQFQKEWGANVIRLAMYTDEPGGYCSDGNKEELKQLLRDGVEYALQADMYVIVDWHILSDGNPAAHQEEALDFFAEMTAEWEEYGHILYEICNEPNGGTTWEEVKDYAEKVIPVILENDSEPVILVGTPNWCQYVEDAADSPIAGYDNLMYTLHFYASTHKEELRKSLLAARKKGLPVFVSEYGICDASGNGGIDYEQAGEWISLLDENQISYVMWNLSNKDETSAILDSGCEKNSGFTKADLSESGLWLLDMLQGNLPYEKSSDDSLQEKSESINENGVPVHSDNKEISGKAVCVNQWEAEGHSYYQYSVELTNYGRDINSWSIEIPFDSEVTLSDSWNGKYTMKGNSLMISNESYNGRITSKGRLTDIGFIVWF